MEINEAIYGRHTVRNYSDKYVSDEVIRKIVTAGMYAPSACNLQNWKFIIVRDGDRSIYYNEIISKAPVLVFVAYRSDLDNVTGYKHKDYVQSAAAAIQNMLLMAYAEGLGTCWICDLPENQILQEHFCVPFNYEVLAAIALGYPENSDDNGTSHKLFHSNTEYDYETRKRKYSLDEVLFCEKYGNSTDISKRIENKEIFSGNCIKEYWIKCMLKIASPVLVNCAHNSLKKNMPIGSRNEERSKKYAYLEALGRTILGISPWLEKKVDDKNENKIKEEYRTLARRSIENAVNPCADDYMNWDKGDQPLVDAAFLALGILQAKTELWDKLSNDGKKNLLREMKKTRKIRPWRSNWILFSAMIEVFIYEMEGENDCIKSVIDYAISQFEQWYVGDGFYKDGDCFHFDYYESIVIHPFLLEISKHIPWIDEEKYILRSLRYSKIILNMINKDGTYPLYGRSLCYRGGVFHLLSKIANDRLNYKDEKNSSLSNAEIRTALMSVLNKYMNSNIFDKDGWLLIGIVDNQEGLAEEYINTGSLYMFLAIFIVLGCDDSFWKGEKEYGFSANVWDGKNIDADSSLEGWIS